MKNHIPAENSNQEPNIESENSTKVPPETESKPPVPTVEKQDELWDEIGFHKPLGGFWYKTILIVVGIFIGVALANIVYTLFFPYPEIQGYTGIWGNMFGVYFTVMAIGNGGTLGVLHAPSAH